LIAFATVALQVAGVQPEVLAAWKEVGLPFPYRAMQATLTVCPAVGSGADPLFITVREFLSDARNSPPSWMFAVYLFHELMHHYVCFSHRLCERNTPLSLQVYSSTCTFSPW
jgi:hypothetical protein